MNAHALLDSWSDTFLVLLAGTTIVWLLATFACRMAASARGQRAVWQMSVLALAGLIICELCGVARGLHELVRTTHTGPVESIAPLPVSLAPPVVAVVATAESSAPSSGLTDLQIEEFVGRTEYSVPSVESSAAIAAHSNNEPSPSVPALAIPGPPTSIEGPRYSPSATLALVWLLGTLLILTRLAIGQLLLMRFARRQTNARKSESPESLHRLTQLSHRVGLRQRPRLVRSTALHSPVAFGLLRPTVGLPTTVERDFSIGQQEAMLAHELAHLANRDPAWRLLADVMVAALWWHPLAWLIRSQFNAACELAADEACLVVEDGPELLAGCLVTLARRVSPAVAPGWLSVQGSGFRSSLGRRVQRLLSLPAASRPGVASFGGICLVGAAALLAVTLISTAWARPQAALTGETSMKRIFSSSWRQSLAGGLLLAALGPSQVALADDEPRKEDRPAAERREGDRPEARRDGDRPAPREGERRDGDRPAPREGDRPAAREGERRDGDRPPAARREGEGDRPAPRRDGERPMPPPPRREGDRPDGARPPREGERDAEQRHDERRHIEEQLGRMKREAAEHKEAGRNDAAEKVMREAQGLVRRLEALRRAEDGARRPDGPPEARRGEGPPPGGRPPFEPGHPPRDELLNVLRDLRAEVQNLRNEVNELKARLREGPRGGEGPPRRDGPPPRGEDRPRDGERPRGEERPRPEGREPR